MSEQTFKVGDRVQWQSTCGHRTGVVVSLTEKRVRIESVGYTFDGPVSVFSNVAIKNVRPA